MTFNIISDIHVLPTRYKYHKNYNVNNFGSFMPEKLLPADYLLIAGDLGIGSNYLSVYDEIVERTRGKFKQVFFVRGNHDYWSLDKPFNKDHQFVKVELDENTVLLGCTLWTPIKEYRPNGQLKWHFSEEYLVHSYMNDFGLIKNFSIKKHNARYAEESVWLHDKCKQYANKKIVIMTHHGPRAELISPIYNKSAINAAYFVTDKSCDDLNPTLWIYGHTHQQSDIIINNTRYVNNAVGYHDVDRYMFVPECNVTTWYNKIVEI